MRIAVLSDIHGNLHALQAVLTDLREHSPDAVANLGDHLSGPLEASRTADLLIGRQQWFQIRGNHDRQLIETGPDRMGLSDAAAYSELSDVHLRWLRELPSTARIDVVTLVHGTPDSDLEYLLETAESGGLRLASAEEIRARSGSVTGDVICCGHSHVPRAVEVDGRLFLNPGSVGLPAYNASDHDSETGSPHSRYALLDRRGSRWHVTFRVVPYEHEAAAVKAATADRRDWEYALRTGYALRS